MPPSIARQHAEWLSLIEVSGPFLSLGTLLRVFPQGLDQPEPEQVRRLRHAYREWDENRGGRRPDAALHTQWLQLVLRELLGLPDELLVAGQQLPAALSVDVPAQEETLRPDLALLPPAGREGGARLLVALYPPTQGLDSPLPERRWQASPAERMVELLLGSNVQLGLVSNGERWLLVNARPGETAGFASWYASLWFDEPVTLRAFVSLLDLHRWFGVSDDHTLPAMLAESAADQTEVTDRLGEQVRRAVEVLVQALDRADKDRGRTLLRDVPETVLYQAGLAVMMRLVFLLSAEERDLLLRGNEQYDRFYAVATLGEQLHVEADRAGEEVLERRYDAWSRLLATFRAVHAGIQHEALRLPAYGGHLFDPDRYPFLEGRAAGTCWRETAAEPLPVHNRTVLHLLDALQFLRVKAAGGGSEARRLSFRALDVEQIGHVYETLLELTARRTDQPLLGLAAAKEVTAIVPLAELERARGAGAAALGELLMLRIKRSEAALSKALAAERDEQDERRLLSACDNDAALRDRVRPFAGLLAPDDNAYPLVITAGSVHVGAGQDRRQTQSHYTPRSLTEPIVRYTLEPLVYDGPAAGKPEGAWRLRSAAQILALKVCDFACGSGAFLVESCRYLAARLVEAWAAALQRLPAGDEPARLSIAGGLAATEGELSVPQEPEARLALARRLVAERCLYGVDKNPQAVEMAKLSLWLVTLDRDRPFTFLDHALRAGDSLLGLRSTEQLAAFHLDPVRGREQHNNFLQLLPRLQAALDLALARRSELELLPVIDVQDAEYKELLHAESRAALADLRLAADALCGAALAHKAGSAELDGELASLANQLRQILDPDLPDERRDAARDDLRSKTRELLNRGRRGEQDERTPFHWPLEFPEVFLAAGKSAPGFDAIVGNPPFLGGQRITGLLGTDYREYLVEQIGGGSRGSADLSAYFFLRGAELLQPSGGCGLLATNTIAQGDTREVGLDRLTGEGCTIVRAVPSRKWPGVANLEVAEVWLRRGGWQGPFLLNGAAVAGITAQLVPPGATAGTPQRLKGSSGRSFQGSIVLGLGFVLTPAERDALVERDARNAEVLFPYLNGEDLNSRPDQSPSRWVINFRDWPLEQAEAYPDCLAIVRERVKPERDKQSDRGGKLYWWRFLRIRPELHDAIAGMERVLVRSRVSDTHAPAFLKPGPVFNEMTVVFAINQASFFAVIQSNVHEAWATARGSTLETRFRYTPSDCFETFPFPGEGKPDARLPRVLDELGERYHEHRRQLMLDRAIGLTAAYNQFNNPRCNDEDIASLRLLHRRLDQEVAAAYGWNDLDLDHGFHEFRGKVRYTIAPAARATVLDRLLQLNLARHAAEVAQGLHDGGGKGGSKRRSQKGVGQGVLL